MNFLRSHSSLTTATTCEPVLSNSHLSYSNAFKNLATSRSFSERVPQVNLQPCTTCEFTSHLDSAPDRKGVIQAGGRDKGFRVDPDNMMIILKDTSISEQDFYTKIAPLLDGSIDGAWDGWRSKFHRSYEFVNKKGVTQATIALENLSALARNPESTTSGFFWHPNIIDIKLGTRLYGSNDPEYKILLKKERANTSTSGTLGVRLSGTKIWDNVTGSYVTYDRKVGFEVDRLGKDLQKKFNRFFPILSLKEGEKRHEELTYDDGGLPKDFVKRIIDESVIPQIKKIHNHVSNFKWRSYNSSLLIVLEGDKNKLEKIMLKSSDLEKFTHVKMIDFASVERADDPDQGLLTGLTTTLELFKTLSNQLE